MKTNKLIKFLMFFFISIQISYGNGITTTNPYVKYINKDNHKIEN